FWPSPALASNSNSPLSSLKSALVLAKIPAHLCMTYFLTTPKQNSPVFGRKSSGFLES
ncbi:MAG: hypothetical protein ACI9UA_006141, partial [Pseudoalteromonas tetraodonis]